MCNSPLDLGWIWTSIYFKSVDIKFYCFFSMRQLKDELRDLLKDYTSAATHTTTLYLTIKVKYYNLIKEQSNLYVCLAACLPTCIPAYQPACRPATCLLAYLTTSLPACLPYYQPACLPT
jgi:hypothetical protein